MCSLPAEGDAHLGALPCDRPIPPQKQSPVDSYLILFFQICKGSALARNILLSGSQSQIHRTAWEFFRALYAQTHSFPAPTKVLGEGLMQIFLLTGSYDWEALVQREHALWVWVFSLHHL